MVGTNVLNEGGTYYKTDRYVMHESYNRPNFANDIAVLKVQGEIEFNDKVQPIDLLADEVPDGTELQLTGWGTLVVSSVLLLLQRDLFFKEINSLGWRFSTEETTDHQIESCLHTKM